MAGHSKWANIKHKKAKEDAKRGQIFTKLGRKITVAAKEGGPDPTSNVRLRLAIEEARSFNMPNDNIERAIQRAVGGLEGVTYSEVLYEGYGPNGVAIMLQALTDNRNRTAGEVRHRFSKYGGNLGESGCVAWMFERRGVLVVERGENVDEDEVMLQALDAGAEDVVAEGDVIEIHTDPSEFIRIKEELEGHGLTFLGAEISFIPQNTVQIDQEQAEKVEKLIELLEELDEVQEVYANYEVQ
ncbi:MAG: YebC/PmpR family DNA-binding transcriptional regulator [Limnochordia bacterium]|jgi:YebC/PmpR family DNA-binding regulatory protein|nr:YebC/PmpR family DNA-binding transcriptional regulator [Bacillota bacterium]NLL07684.1 YebC/PmpR family DNA-binding transcriptional regulator [Bacillota bacterium]HBG08469.1 YebC/PmpR family DNA-binding transcriptional regulator [Bacillota bacterium]